MGKLIFQIVYPYPKDTSKNIYPHNIDFKPMVQKWLNIEQFCPRKFKKIKPKVCRKIIPNSW
jgi:hypothetical protein